MKKISFLRPVRQSVIMLLLGVSVLLAGCGYQLQGFQTPAAESVLGDGSKRILLVDVEQTTLYPWVAPMIRSLVRDEIHLRKLGHMVDSGPADFTLHVRVPYFHIRAYISNDDDDSLLNYAAATMEMEVRRWEDGAIEWRSGSIQYSERYEDPIEEYAVREVLTQVIRRIMDNIQQRF